MNLKEIITNTAGGFQSLSVVIPTESKVMHFNVHITHNRAEGRGGMDRSNKQTLNQDHAVCVPCIYFCAITFEVALDKY